MEHIEELLDKLHLEDLQNQMHPAIFDINDDYNMLIIRLPLLTKELQVHSDGFIITEENSYLYHRETRTFEPLSSQFESIHLFLDKKVDNLLKSFVTLQDKTADMEEALYSNERNKHFMSTWLHLKRDILRIERVLLRTSTIMNEFNDYYEDSENFPVNHFMDLHEHIDRTVRSAALQLTKLDYLYTFHTEQTNEKMNRLIYILTIISGVFLPLNLLVGFFGMNTTDLPFSKEPAGTLNAVLIMLSLFVVSSGLVYLWKKRYLK